MRRTSLIWKGLVIVAIAFSLVALLTATGHGIFDLPFWVMFALGIVTLIVALIIAFFERSLAINMARSQIDEKTAMMFGYALEVQNKFPRPSGETPENQENPSSGAMKYWLERVITDITALERIKDEMSSDQETRLRRAEAALIEELRSKKYNHLGNQIDATFNGVLPS